MDRRSLLIAAGAALAGPGQAQVPTSVAEPLRFDSGGRSMRAVCFRPAQPSMSAGLVYMHGSGSIGHRQLAYAQRFADQQGMLVLVPVYTDAGADDGVRGARLMNAWRDCAVDSVDWLIAQGAPEAKVAIVGYSLGSHIAVDSALGGGRARAAVGVAAGWDVYAPRPPRRRVPVLIVRAASDDHVSPSSTDRLVRFLRDAEVAVRDVRIPDAEHLMTDAQWAEAHRLTADFLTDALDLS